MPEPIPTTAGRVRALTDADAAYVARWVAISHPQIAADGLDALARYRRDHPDPSQPPGTPPAGES